jgi:hypothetical protein
MTQFNIESKKTTDKFLQSVIFIDDKAYCPTDTGSQHDFDARQISNIFAKEGKICAVYKPETTDDIDVLSSLAKKSDIAVLDWQIVLNETADEGYDDDDDEQDDIRGVYTKKIIRNLLSDFQENNTIKLIVVYTGEVDLKRIAIEIKQEVNNLLERYDMSFEFDDEDECSLRLNCCKIVVLAKSNRDEQSRRHLPYLDRKTVTYEDLPSKISDEFSTLSRGLLSNFAMESLAEIRGNFNYILSLFSNHLDTAYLTHQALTPNSSDANELLVELLGDTFVSMLRDRNLNTMLSSDYIDKWIEDNIEEKKKDILELNGNSVQRNATYTRNKDLVRKLLTSHTDVVQHFRSSFDQFSGNSVSDKSAKKLIRRAIDIFDDNESASELNTKNIRFANLCYLKSSTPSSTKMPNLTLGTVVKSTTKDEYYVCIQQRCDSVRVSAQEKRRFLFLSLTKVNNDEGKFSFFTPDKQKLLVSKGTYSLRTVKFSGVDSVVSASWDEINEKLYFTPSHYSEDVSEKFEFVTELKSMYSQRLVEMYSASLSRVGIDEPEWVLQLN